MDQYELRHLVETRQYNEIAKVAGMQPRVLSRLLALTYIPEDEFGWKAVWALGKAAAGLAPVNPEFVVGILRRLQWSLNDESGGIGWRAPAAMGSILAACPGKFDEFAPIIASFLDLEESWFYPGVLWAIGLIAPITGWRMVYIIPRVRSFLGAPDPSLRGLAAWALKRMGSLGQAPTLSGDTDQFAFFNGAELRSVTVSAMARNEVAIEGVLPLVWSEADNNAPG